MYQLRLITRGMTCWTRRSSAPNTPGLSNSAGVEGVHYLTGFYLLEVLIGKVREFKCLFLRD